MNKRKKRIVKYLKLKFQIKLTSIHKNLYLNTLYANSTEEVLKGVHNVNIPAHLLLALLTEVAYGITQSWKLVNN